MTAARVTKRAVACRPHGEGERARCRERHYAIVSFRSFLETHVIYKWGRSSGDAGVFGSSQRFVGTNTTASANTRALLRCSVCALGKGVVCGGSETVCSNQDGRGVAQDTDAATVRCAARAHDRSARIVCPAVGAPGWHILVRRLRADTFRRRTKVRERHRLAELQLPGRRIDRHDRGSQLRNDAHRSPLQPLWRTSRACLPRRPSTDGPALLHQWRGSGVRAGDARRAFVINNLWP
jgi:hypothetical protein